nr:MAG TPA: hypothetical protein [Caudoviricetes sp.]
MRNSTIAVHWYPHTRDVGPYPICISFHFSKNRRNQNEQNYRLV